MSEPTTITPPPQKIENKMLSLWINSVYSSLKSMDKKISFLEKQIELLNEDKK